ncbi:MAG: hypothetical protein DWH94_03255 [Planctomycetota bacterium]|nr:MAG: hypothetical protein DWH94_03255 [Planctomycetota bacterium]
MGRWLTRTENISVGSDFEQSRILRSHCNRLCLRFAGSRQLLAEKKSFERKKEREGKKEANSAEEWNCLLVGQAMRYKVG